MRFFQLSFYAFLVFLLASLASCQDNCEQTYTEIAYEPVYTPLSEFRDTQPEMQAARVMENTGKIYLKYPYVFVNEQDKGIHIIDDSNPQSPQTIGFLAIPGNRDVAIKGSTLYADSYTDLLAIDITDLTNPRLLDRTPWVFMGNFMRNGFHLDPEKGLVTEWKEVLRTVTEECDDVNPRNDWGRAEDDAATPDVGSGDAGGGSDGGREIPGGVGGSMARFTLYQNYLYTLGGDSLFVFDLQNPAAPQSANKKHIGMDIETIFPYEDKLFFGAMTGMHIFNNQNPVNPRFMSTYEHVRVCDPVVAQEDFAYVTLRTDNNRCGGWINQLEVLDISNLYSPQLVGEYPMMNPHGLGIDDETLFVCDGKNGLRVFDATDPLRLQETAHYPDYQAFDVIPWGGLLLLIGEDGLYQYRYNSPEDITFLSHIATRP